MTDSCSIAVSGCLQEENSVLDPADVVDLLKKIGNAELVSA